MHMHRLEGAAVCRSVYGGGRGASAQAHSEVRGRQAAGSSSWQSACTHVHVHDCIDQSVSAWVCDAMHGHVHPHGHSVQHASGGAVAACIVGTVVVYSMEPMSSRLSMDLMASLAACSPPPA